MQDIIPPNKRNKRSIQNVTPPRGKRSANRDFDDEDKTKRTTDVENSTDEDREDNNREGGDEEDRFYPGRSRVEYKSDSNDRSDDPGPEETVESNEQDGEDGEESDPGSREEEFVCSRLPRGSKNRGGYWGIILGIVVILVIYFGSYLFSVADIKVVFDAQTEAIESEYTAVSIDEKTPGDLYYDYLETTVSSEQTVEASGMETREQKAEGKVTLYNEYSDTEIPLRLNTRVADEEGREYEIPEAITLPGMSDGEPGSVTVPVVAKEPGDEYNIEGDVKFVVPGLETDFPEMFANIYAELEESITGGVIERQPVVDDEQRQAAEERLRDVLEEELQDDSLDDEVRRRFIYPQGGRMWEFETEIKAAEDDDAAVVVMIGRSFSLLLEREELTQLLADELLSEEKSSGVRVDNLDDLNIEVLSDDFSSGVGEVELKITGDVKFSWSVENEELQESLAHVRRGDFHSILEREFPGVVKAEVDTLWPIWRLSFPDRENIRITRVDEL